MVANPAVIPQLDGTLLMAYRGLDDRGVGMAVAPRWDSAFARLNGGAAVLGPEAASPTAVLEDMLMWRTRRGIEMLLHQEQTGDSVGAHAFSVTDGRSWQLAPGPAYNLTVVDTGGSTVQYARRERPQILWDGAVATHLFNGVQDADGFTHTIAVPLGRT